MIPHHDDEFLNYANSCGVLDACNGQPCDPVSRNLTRPALLEAYGHGYYMEMYLAEVARRDGAQ